MVTVTGTLVNAIDGTPHKGVGFIEPTAPVVLDTAGNKVRFTGKGFALDAQGSFSVQVPASDDPGLSPSGFTYRVGFRLEDGEMPDTVFAAPAALVAVDLADMVPLVDSLGVATVAAPQDVFVQPTNPNMTSPGLWVDTTGGDVTFWIEDGL